MQARSFSPTVLWLRGLCSLHAVVAWLSKACKGAAIYHDMQGVELKSLLPILPLFELDEPGGKAGARGADAANGALCGIAKDSVAAVQSRPDGLAAVHSTPEEQSVRTDQDMGTPEAPPKASETCCSLPGASDLSPCAPWALPASCLDCNTCRQPGWAQPVHGEPAVGGGPEPGAAGQPRSAAGHGRHRWPHAAGHRPPPPAPCARCAHQAVGCIRRCWALAPLQ
jgi:hypothetical protein